MGYGLSIQISQDSASPALGRLIEHMHSPSLRKVMARGVSNLVKEHLINLDKERANKLGGRRTHMYRRAAHQTTYEANDQGFKVSIAHEAIAQRYFGGPISIVNKQWLTIPAVAKSYGRTAAEFGKLRLVIFGGKYNHELGALFTPTTYTAKGNKKKSSGELLFWLKKNLNKDQDPDPSVLPTEDQIIDSAVDAAEESLYKRFHDYE